MQCPKCNALYQREKNVPLLLIKCGHTLCDQCAAKAFDGKSIICAECHSQSQITALSSLPKNMALLAMSQASPPAASLPADSHPPASEEVLCPLHKKKLEAFCQDDRALLCIDCILLDGHKSHDISPIGQASAKERADLQLEIEVAAKQEETLNLLASDLGNFRADLNEKANGKREKITAVFKEITNVIHERESVLKQNISNILEKEEDLLNTTSTKIQEQLKSIAAFRKDAAQISEESNCALLQRSRDRRQQAAEANKPSPNIVFSVNFPDVRKETELTTLWKLLSPQSAKQPGSGIYATTASYANKRTERKGSFKSHQDSHMQKFSKDKKRQGNDAATSVMEKILSPRRDGFPEGRNKFSRQPVPTLNSSILSSISNISIQTSKSAIQKEECKVSRPAAGKKSDPAEITPEPETETGVSVGVVPTALITMPAPAAQTTPGSPAEKYPRILDKVEV